MSRLRREIAVMRRVVAYGLLGGIVVTVFEIGALADVFTPRELLLFLGSSWARWASIGVLLALLTHVIGPRLRPATTVPGVALIVSLGLAPQLLIRDGETWPVPAFQDANGLHATWGYWIWQGIFYGGLLVFTCVLLQRSDRTRELLGQAQIARSRAEAALSEAHLQSLQGQIDPAFLLRVLDVVQQRYAGERSEGDLLLDQLVVFLRNAMPGIRSGTSTLEGELAFARSYLSLRAALDPEGGSWRVEADNPLPDLPFPPLMLPLLIDQLTAFRAGSPSRRLIVRVRDARLTLQVDAPVGPGWLPEALAYRLRVALSTTWPDGWLMRVNGLGEPGGPAFTLMLPLEAGCLLGAAHLRPARPAQHLGVD